MNGSTCETVTSKSLAVEVYWFPNRLELCSKIQGTLLTLHSRIETFSVYLSNTKIIEDDMRKLYPRLYGAGIVIEKCLDDDELVSHHFLSSKLRYSACYFPACVGFRSIILHISALCLCAPHPFA